MDTWHVFKLDKFDPKRQMQHIHGSFPYCIQKNAVFIYHFFLEGLFNLCVCEVALFALVEMLS